MRGGDEREQCWGGYPKRRGISALRRDSQRESRQMVYTMLGLCEVLQGWPNQDVCQQSTRLPGLQIGQRTLRPEGSLTDWRIHEYWCGREISTHTKWRYLPRPAFVFEQTVWEAFSIWTIEFYFLCVCTDLPDLSFITYYSAEIEVQDLGKRKKKPQGEDANISS